MIRIRSGDTVTELAWTGENIPAARLLAQAGLYPDYPCGGQGRCGKCRVLAHGDLCSRRAGGTGHSCHPGSWPGVCALPALPGSAAPTRS